MERLIKDNILFYDSDCGLCQRSVQILLKLDKKNKDPKIIVTIDAPKKEESTSE